MGCNSVYTQGYRNVFEDPTGKRLAEGRALCEHALEPLLERSRLSVSYGYISPELSRQIVKYMNPDSPSYHRWDAGAAADVALHETGDEAPVYTAFWLDNNVPVSRVITYSESPYICVGVRAEEVASGDPRRALYENRYVGERKPQYIRYADAPAARKKQKKELVLDHDWRGAGYPTYHGGGKLQFQHTRTSDYTMLSDWLYSDIVAAGERIGKLPPMSMFHEAGRIYDEILKSVSLRRMSIVRGYEPPAHRTGVQNWADGVYFVVVPPESADPKAVVKAALKAGASIAKVGRDRRVCIGHAGFKGENDED